MKRAYLTLGTSLVVLASAAVAQADFTGYYDHANWVFTQLNGGNGYIDTATDSTLVMVGGDDGSGNSSDDYYTITAEADGMFSFDWVYNSEDDPGFDAGYYYVNTYIYLSSTDGESGSISVPVLAGDVIGFNVYSVDQVFGPGVLTITNFSGPTAVPEPASMAVLGLGALALAKKRARK